MLNSINKTEDPVILANLWNKFNKNQLAEMGIKTKIRMNVKKDKESPSKQWPAEESKELQSESNPTVVQSDAHDIIFVDPDRIKKEKQEKDDIEDELDGKIIAPITMGKSLTKTKRSQYLRLLKIKNRKIASKEEIRSMNKHTAL